MDFLLFTKSDWDEAPRLRHQVAALLADAGHEVLFFERPRLTRRAARRVRDRVTAVRTRNVVHPQLRVSRALSAVNNAVEKREIRRAAPRRPSVGIVNFNYEYEFLRDLFPDSRIVTVINDDFIDGARPFSRREAARVLAATARMSDQNVAVSFPLVAQLQRFSDRVELFLPWTRTPYVRPAQGLPRTDLLYWGYINDRIDVRSVLHVMDAGIRIHFAGPVIPSPKMKRMLGHPLASHHQPASLRELADVVDRCCASILPYDIEYKQVAAITMNNRSFEILGAGLPLLYSDLPGLIDAPPNVIYRCATPDSYVRSTAAARDSFDASQDAIAQFLTAHSPEARYEQLMGYFR
jgi:hypothetical protein